ncbi:NF-kappa-B inhibitor-like protein 1 [Brienomyrus brachyistius]|uniref:NF-kappa-B inhibitor-like protein 1 n=1 Tax=Brienomyrus brachyistius TaxID=42636 RepID=UPI0020B3C858|nr:NF-kappa-B inhibitor-like protein 1 [Brienomyrus brachyistius]
MVSSKQKRILRYVEEGSLLKLKSYLRKHPDTELNFQHGRKRRSPLHLACGLRNDAVLRLLLKRGADALQRDRRGNTALHIAASMALKHGQTAYNDLVIPLQKYCPFAMDMPNCAGVTPQDLLGRMKAEQLHDLPQEGSSQAKLDSESQWREKLLGECQDEFFETYGHYDDDSLRDGDSEDFGQWADRIWQEYHGKRRAEAQRRMESKEQTVRRRRRPENAEAGRELQARLEREHAEYVERAARKTEEVLRGKRQRYEERCAEALGSDAQEELGYADIPWPLPHGSVSDMVAVLVHGAERSDPAAFRRLLRRQQALWHPDKFSQRCGGRLREAERQRILDTVTALSQELNRLAQSVR